MVPFSTKRVTWFGIKTNCHTSIPATLHWTSTIVVNSTVGGAFLIRVTINHLRAQSHFGAPGKIGFDRFFKKIWNIMRNEFWFRCVFYHLRRFCCRRIVRNLGDRNRQVIHLPGRHRVGCNLRCFFDMHPVLKNVHILKEKLWNLEKYRFPLFLSKHKIC